MSASRIPRRPPPKGAGVASFLGRLLPRRTQAFPTMAGRAPAIDPAVLEAMIATSGWVSWETVHFISGIAPARNEK
jgi:hypothetical protein